MGGMSGGEWCPTVRGVRMIATSRSSVGVSGIETRVMAARVFNRFVQVSVQDEMYILGIYISHPS